MVDVGWAMESIPIPFPFPTTATAISEQHRVDLRYFNR